MMLNPYVPLKEKLSQPRIAAEEPRGAAGEESMLWNRFEAECGGRVDIFERIRLFHFRLAGRRSHDFPSSAAPGILGVDRALRSLLHASPIRAQTQFLRPLRW